MSVNTKAAPRRTLSFKSWQDVLAELDRIEQAHNAGTLTHTGNWSPGQNMDHAARLIRCAFDGFDGQAPAPVRFFVRLFFKSSALGPKPMPAGFKLPKAASSMLPADNVSTPEGLTLLRDQLHRLTAGEKMTQPSPVFGRLTHDEWTTIQLKHLALHLSFLSY